LLWFSSKSREVEGHKLGAEDAKKGRKEMKKKVVPLGACSPGNGDESMRRKSEIGSRSACVKKGGMCEPIMGYKLEGNAKSRKPKLFKRIAQQQRGDSI